MSREIETPIEQKLRGIDKAVTQMENAVEKLEQALSGNSPVSKNTLIREAIKLLKG